MIGILSSDKEMERRVPETAKFRTIYYRSEGSDWILRYDIIEFSMNDVDSFSCGDGEMYIDWKDNENGNYDDYLSLNYLYTDKEAFYRCCHIDARRAEDDDQQSVLKNLDEMRKEAEAIRWEARDAVNKLRQNKLYTVANEVNRVVYLHELSKIVNTVVTKMGTETIQFYSRKENKNVTFDCSMKHVTNLIQGNTIYIHVEDDDIDGVRMMEYLGYLL